MVVVAHVINTRRLRGTKHLARLHAWTDESGNSGLNVFDTGQTMFWSGTLLSPVDLDSITSPHAEWLSIVQAHELHAKLLPFHKLNAIADSVREFLICHDCRFVFTRIDKEYHVLTTFVAMIFDSDVNEAVAPLYDHVPIFRKEAAKQLSRICPHRDRKEFWDAYMRRDIEAFSALLLNLEARARVLYTDRRAAELLCGALEWARLHPERIMESRMSEEDSPNARALLLLVDGIRKIAGDKARVIRFRHDEQPEFRRTLTTTFETIKNAFGPLGSPYAPLFARPYQLFECSLEMVPSRDSLGLQLIDILLSLMSRHLNGTYAPREDESGALLGYVRSDDRAIINQILFAPEDDLELQELETLVERSSLIVEGAHSLQELVLEEKFRRTGLSAGRC